MLNTLFDDDFTPNAVAKNTCVATPTQAFSQNAQNLFTQIMPTNITIESIKELGLKRSEANLKHLIKLFYEDLEIELKREIVSSIGRQENNDKIYEFVQKEALNSHYMELVYQMFRTTLYKIEDKLQLIFTSPPTFKLLLVGICLAL